MKKVYGELNYQTLFPDGIVGDYKEGYYIGVEVPEDDPEAEKPFYGPNVWPADGKIEWISLLIILQDLFKRIFHLFCMLLLTLGRCFAWMEADYGEISS